MTTVTKTEQNWAARHVDRTRVIVDNSKGAEAQFVSNLRATLSAAGFEVELRGPSPQAMYDTAVHFVVEGVSVRVSQELGRHELEIVAAAVRDAEAHRRTGAPAHRALARPSCGYLQRRDEPRAVMG